MEPLKKLLMLPGYIVAAKLGIFAYLRLPKCFSRGQVLIAKTDFPAFCFVDYGMTSTTVGIVVPKGTEVIYRGPSKYADFGIKLPEDIVKSLGATLFSKASWLLSMPPSVYTIEVTCKEPLNILAAK